MRFTGCFRSWFHLHSIADLPFVFCSRGLAIPKRPSSTGSEQGEDEERSSPSCGSSSKCQKRDDNADKTKEVLLRILENKARQVDSLQKKNKLLSQTVRRQKKKIGTLESEIQRKNQLLQNKSSFEVSRVSDTPDESGKSGSWFTPAGAISLAVA